MITGTPFIFIILKCFTTQGQTITGGKKAVLFFEKKTSRQLFVKILKEYFVYVLLSITKNESQ